MILEIARRLFSVTRDPYAVTRALQSMLQVCRAWHRAFAAQDDGMALAFWRRILPQLCWTGARAGRRFADAADVRAGWHFAIDRFGCTFDVIGAAIQRRLQMAPSPDDARRPLVARYFVDPLLPPPPPPPPPPTGTDGAAPPSRPVATPTQTLCLDALLDLYVYVRWQPVAPARAPFYRGVRRVTQLGRDGLSTTLFRKSKDFRRTAYHIHLRTLRRGADGQPVTPRALTDASLCISGQTITMQCCDTPVPCGCRMRFRSLADIVAFLRDAERRGRRRRPATACHFRKYTGTRRRVHQ